MTNFLDLKSTYRQLPKGFYQAVEPTAVARAQGLLFNHKLASDLGMLNESPTPDTDYPTHLIDVFSGNDIFDGVTPIAQAYAGHQFGHFNKLGDGRAVLLGEYSRGEDLIDIQLKGSGPTAFSRTGDGRAALGPMLREYIISEAMHYLGVPTTRSLSVCLSGEKVRRSDFLQGAVLTRLASSHIRVGTFEYAAAFLGLDDLKALADYVISRHYPESWGSQNPYQELLNNVIREQALLISKWMKFGFIHGVMNTDNVSVAGQTIDYGPCAFLESYEPNQVFSSIDHQRRYAYDQQPHIAHWNLARFAETLLPLLDDKESEALTIARECLSLFQDQFAANLYKEMLSKIGIENSNEESKTLLTDLLKIMEQHKFDFTNTFVHLTNILGNDKSDASCLDENSELSEWKKRWLSFLSNPSADLDSAKNLMKQNNPLRIPRNHLVEKALTLAEEESDLSLFLDLLDAVRNPFIENERWNLFQKPAEAGERVFQTFCGT